MEALVDRSHEWYPRGGLRYLVGGSVCSLMLWLRLMHPHQRRGLNWLQEAGMRVILDHHALPGVQTPGQMFTGKQVIICLLPILY